MAADTAMTAKHWMIVSLVVAFIAGGAAFSSIARSGGSAAHPTPFPLGYQPPLDLPPSGDGVRPTPEGEGFSLSYPIPTSLTLDIGGRTFIAPEGATVLEHHDERPPVGSTSEPPQRLSYTTVRLDASFVRIDSDTGEVFEWNVSPAHEAAFASFQDARVE